MAGVAAVAAGLPLYRLSIHFLVAGQGPDSTAAGLRGRQPLQFVSQPFVSDIDHTGELSEVIVTLPPESSRRIRWIWRLAMRVSFRWI